MGNSRWEQYKEKNGSTPIDLLNPRKEVATKETAKERMKVCLSCPELIKITKQCKKCGCFMELKTKLENAKCPIGKW